MNIKTHHLEQILKNISDTEYHLNVDISHLSTMRLKSVGNYVLVTSMMALIELLKTINKEGIKYKMIGWGANQILPLDATNQLFIKLKPPQNSEQFFVKDKDHFILPAGLGLNILVSQAIKMGFKGWEVLTGIPASVGGAAFMNAGTKYGDFSKIISRVFIANQNGEEKIINITNTSYGYRKNYFLKEGEVITQVEVFHHGIDTVEVPKKINDYMDYRKKTQPLKSNNCGCIFKNPKGESAGQIIDQLGLKGLQVGQMRVSTLHGNFLENVGGATAQDFWNLVDAIQEKVQKARGNILELEISS